MTNSSFPSSFVGPSASVSALLVSGANATPPLDAAACGATRALALDLALDLDLGLSGGLPRAAVRRLMLSCRWRRRASLALGMVGWGGVGGAEPAVSHVPPPRAPVEQAVGRLEGLGACRGLVSLLAALLAHHDA